MIPTNDQLHDPTLTSLGETQCHELCRDFPYHESIDLLVSSPLRRTLSTTLLSFKPQTQRGLKIIALPELQEVADVPCDTGSDVETLKKELENQPVDLSRVRDGWNSKQGEWDPTDNMLHKRARKVRQWLKSRPEKNIVVVTHGGIVHYLTEDWTDSSKFAGALQSLHHLVKVPADPLMGIDLGTGWANAEFRSYRFVDEAGENEAMKETDESRERRRGTEKPFTEAEQRQLKSVQKTSPEGRE